jgi:hypothetical protein
MLKFIKLLFHLLVPRSLQQQIRQIRSLAANIRLPIYRIDHAGLTVIQIGRESLDPYIVRLLYGEFLKSEKVGSVLVWNLARAIRRWEARADLIFFRDTQFRPPGELASRMLMLPYFAQQVVDLPFSSSGLLAHFFNEATHWTLKSNMRSIRKARFEHEFTRDPELLNYFYHHLYAPYINERYLDTAEVLPWPSFQAVYGGMELLLIRRKGRIVAGCVNQQIGNTYRMHVAGVLCADKDFLKTGIVSALYWFSFSEAHRLGCREVDLGVSRPFLRDGLLVYKKKWRSRTTTSIYKRPGLWLLPCGNRPPMYRALEDNPFFCEHDGRLTGLIFLGDHTVLNDKELASYLQQAVCSGECLSIWIVLLTRAWTARAEAIQGILKNHSQTPRLLDLSRGSLAELPGLLRDRETDSGRI